MMKHLHLKSYGSNMLIITKFERTKVGSIDFESKVLSVIREYETDGEIEIIRNYYELLIKVA